MFQNKKLMVGLMVMTAVFFYFSAVFAVQVSPTSANANNNVNTNIGITTEDVSSKLITSSNLTEYLNTYYAGGETVAVNGHFYNDVVIAANNVTIDGIVDGDILTAGTNVTIKAEVKGDVRAAGGNVIIEGLVHKNTTLAGGQVEISENAALSKDLVVFGGTVQILGPVYGNVKVYSGQVTLNNTISGNADLDESEITFGEQAQVMGDLSYVAAADMALDVSDQVEGQIKRTEPTATPASSTKEDKSGWDKYGTSGFWMWNLLKMLGLLLVGLIVSSLCKQTTNNVVKNMYASPFRGLLIGLLVFIFTPIVAIIAMFTVIGLPLGMISLACYFVLLYVSMVFVGAAIGKKIMPSAASLVGPTFIGLIIVYCVKMIPYIGLFIVFLAVLWALGSLMKKCSCCCEEKPINKNPAPEMKMSLKARIPAKKVSHRKTKAPKNSRTKK